MRVRKLKLNNRSYDIIVGANLFDKIARYMRAFNVGDSAYIITNPPLKSRYGAAISGALKRSGLGMRFRTVADSEKSKSVRAASAVINDLARFDKRRRVFIVAFGGGVVGDLAGFVASIYKRGIPYFQVPTTLLAQVDSAIGGKTGVDLTQGKNLVGTFYQPRAVFCDISLLRTLDNRQIKSGLAEVIKYGIIKDPKLFAYLEKNYRKVLALDKAALEFIVEKSTGIKAKIVQQDVREEKGIRTILNFGHTIGHAIEAAGGFKSYNHGEAIAVGMLAATDLSAELGLIKADTAERIEGLISGVGLPTRVKGVPLARIIRAHYHDKKFIGKKNRFVLIKGIGRPTVKENIPLAAIRAAVAGRA